jgi:hypothetical protein
MVLMTTYKQFATTAYQKESFEIHNVLRTSGPDLLPQNASEVQAIWNTAFKPTNESQPVDIMMINSVIYALT